VKDFCKARKLATKNNFTHKVCVYALLATNVDYAQKTAQK